MQHTWHSDEGSPIPLGVHWIPQEHAYNFALYSHHATEVTLLLYRTDDLRHPVVTFAYDHLKNKSGRVWHMRIHESDMNGAEYYAYRVDGPPPAGVLEWHHFNPQKILFDPYARALHFPRSFSRAAAIGPEDNAGRAPLGIVRAARSPFDWTGDRRPYHESDLVIYEMHVRGFTRRANSDVTPERRGTYLGVIEKIPYLRELGVTAVELMPVFQFDPQSEEYWGYNPLSFFAPHRGFAVGTTPTAPMEEFRSMVRACHQAGIEVILDVVYNHTGEADHTGPVYSYKGIDNSTYYFVGDPPERPYADFTGVKNTLHCANRHTQQLILDSLRYWVTRMHVDGFRFDLASVFARRPDGTLGIDDPPIIGQIASDPALAHIRLIAEPWDAAGTYQLGRSFPGLSWFQWNGQFRDDVRRFVRGDDGCVDRLLTRLYGSDDLFPDSLAYAYHPYQSINYITSHDGCTLYDLVAYNTKHNWANGLMNTDGPADDFSWNCGHEGDDDVPADVMRLRKQQAKNFCCLLMLANGTPMLRAGDEFLQTQCGNNNPFNQDNETSWLDWSRLEAHADVFRFFRCMIAFRKNHTTLCRSRYWREDVRWYGVGPQVDLGHDSHTLAFALNGEQAGDASLYVMINAWREPLVFAIQEAGPWLRVVDTSRAAPEDIVEPGEEVAWPLPTYNVDAHSIVVLVSHI